jgi:hypothetical protein
MLSVKEYAVRIGQKAELAEARGLTYFVRILDVKEAYGQIRYKVAPIYGSGEAWVDAGAVSGVET